MTTIKNIINRYHTHLQIFGFLSRPQTAQQSDRVKQMRPSLRKVSIALQEDPELLKRNVQPSPMAVLFDLTLPKIEHVLMEVGEQRGAEIVYALVEHGVKMIAEHTLEGAREHLEELFGELAEYEGRLKEDGGIEGIIEAYRKLDFEGRGEDYLRLRVVDKIENMEITDDGMIYLHMKESTNDSDLFYLRKVKNLQQLFLYKTRMSDAGLKHLEGLINLQELYLGLTQVSDAGLKYLKGLKDLSQLSLAATRVSDAGLEHLKGLKNLQRLYLAETQVSDAGLKHLKELKNLQELYLDATRVSDAGLEYLKGLKNLRRLDLEETQVSDAGLKHLKGLKNLQMLDLAATQVSDAGLEHLKGLINLQDLYLRGTRVSDEGIDELKVAIPGLKIFK